MGIQDDNGESGIGLVVGWENKLVSFIYFSLLARHS